MRYMNLDAFLAKILEGITTSANIATTPVPIGGKVCRMGKSGMRGVCPMNGPMRKRERRGWNSATEAGSRDVVIGKSGPIVKPGEYDVRFHGYIGIVEVSIYEGDLIRTKKNQNPQGVSFDVYLDVETYESSEIANDLDVKGAFEASASRVLGIPVTLSEGWYEAMGSADFDRHMRNSLHTTKPFRVTVRSDVIG